MQRLLIFSLLAPLGSSAASLSRRNLFHGGAFGLFSRMLPAPKPPSPALAADQAVRTLRRTQLLSEARQMPTEVWDFRQITFADRALHWAKHESPDPVLAEDLAHLRRAYADPHVGGVAFEMTREMSERWAKRMHEESGGMFDDFVDRFATLEAEIAARRHVDVAHVLDAIRLAARPVTSLEKLLGRNHLSWGDLAHYDDELVREVIDGLGQFAPEYASRVRTAQFVDFAAAKSFVREYYGGLKRYWNIEASIYWNQPYARLVEAVEQTTDNLLTVGAARLLEMRAAREEIRKIAGTRLGDLVGRALDEWSHDFAKILWHLPTDARRSLAKRQPSGDESAGTEVLHVATEARWINTLSVAIGQAGLELAEFVTAADVECTAALAPVEAIVSPVDDQAEVTPAIAHQPVDPLLIQVPREPGIVPIPRGESISEP